MILTIRDLDTGAEQVIRTTETHPFYVEGKRKPSLHLTAQTSEHGDLSDNWVNAGKLVPGDRLVNPDRSFAEVVAVRSEPKEKFKAYNLSVEDYETFFVNADAGSDPVWVHNARGCNNLKPDPNATGAHTTFRRDGNGDITNYQNWWPNPRNPNGFDAGKRVDLKGGSHKDRYGNPVPTPHVHEPGDKFARPASPSEIPGK